MIVNDTCTINVLLSLALANFINNAHKWCHSLGHHLLMTLESSFTIILFYNTGHWPWYDLLHVKEARYCLIGAKSFLSTYHLKEDLLYTKLSNYIVSELTVVNVLIDLLFWMGWGLSVYKKRVLVQNKLNLLLKIFWNSQEH